MSNLLKNRYTKIESDNFRVLDMNALFAKRLEKIETQIEQAENKGFMSDIQADVLDVDALLSDDLGGDGFTDLSDLSSIIKVDPGPDPQEVLSGAREEAERIIAEANAQAEMILAQAVEEAQNRQAAIFDDATRQGYQEGQARAAQEIEAMRAKLLEEQQELEEACQKRMDDMEPELVEVITGIYEHIFHVELSGYRDILLHLIQTTIRGVEENRSFIVHVSKEDYAAVSMRRDHLMAGIAAQSATIEIVEDLTLKKNECMIETEGGIFDCSLGTELRELGNKLKLLAYEKK